MDVQPIKSAAFRPSLTAASVGARAFTVSTAPDKPFVPKAAATAWVEQAHAQTLEVREKSLSALQGYQDAVALARQQAIDHYNAFIQVCHLKGGCVIDGLARGGRRQLSRCVSFCNRRATVVTDDPRGPATPGLARPTPRNAHTYLFPRVCAIRICEFVRPRRSLRSRRSCSGPGGRLRTLSTNWCSSSRSRVPRLRPGRRPRV